jgi:nucleoid DNA-binding protein
MSKVYLTNAVSRTLDISSIKADAYVTTVIDSIKKGIKEEGRVVIRGFGIFTSKHKNERRGRNPKTGEPAVIKARTVVKFSASKVFKDIVNNIKQVNTKLKIHRKEG